MSYDSNSVSVGQTGHVYLADADTVEPAFQSEPDAPWADLGFLSEAGVAFEFGLTVTGVPAWQARSSVRELVTDEPATCAFTAIEFRPAILRAALRGGTLSDNGTGSAAKFTPPASGANPVVALYVTEIDEDNHFAYYMPRAELSQPVTWTLARAAAKSIPLTFTLLDPDDGDRWVATSDLASWMDELAGSSS